MIDHKFKKKFGQNFISDTNLLRAIVTDAGVNKDDEVLEIGAGAGTLTKELASCVKKVVSYEIDKDLQDILLSERPENVKYYFEDVGLRNARLGFRQVEETHLMENIIYNELRSRGYSVDVGLVEKRGRDVEGKSERKQLEIDFVANMGSRRYYIQSAYSLPDEAKRTQEIRPFRKIDDSFKKIVITKDIVQPCYDDYGILTVNIYDFLLDPQILEK